MQNTYEVRPVVGYEGLYSISNTGEVFSHNYRHTGQTKQLKAVKLNTGYLRVVLYQDGKLKTHLIHRLVLEAFIDNPENKQFCDHIDTNPSNNHVSNLRWVTPKENMNNPLSLKNKSEALKGKTHSEQHRRKVSEAGKDKTIYTFRNKNTGEVFVGTQYDFRTKHDLVQGAVSSLTRGRYKSTKGWVLA